MPLKVSDGMSAWIDDFKKSDAPQFKDKSDKERRDQAIAAYMSAKKEGLEEGKPGLWTNIHNKRKRGEKPNPAGHPDRPTAQDFKDASKKESTDVDKLTRMRKMVDKEKTKVPHKPKDEYDRKVGSYLKKKYNKEEVEEGVPEGTGSLKPGWMLKKDPELAQKLKNKLDLAKKRQATYGDKSAGKSVKEEVELGEETTFEVEVEGLPTMYVKAKSPGEVKANLRKIVKQPSMITGVTRVTDADMKKIFRDKAQGREEEDVVEAVSPMIAPPKTKQFATQDQAFAYKKQHGGKVLKSTFINPRTGIKDVSYVVKEEAEFQPHMMYDPKTGKAYKADKEEDHVRMKKLGYTHVKPKEK